MPTRVRRTWRGRRAPPRQAARCSGAAARRRAAARSGSTPSTPSPSSASSTSAGSHAPIVRAAAPRACSRHPRRPRPHLGEELEPPVDALPDRSRRRRPRLGGELHGPPRGALELGAGGERAALALEEREACPPVGRRGPQRLRPRQRPQGDCELRRCELGEPAGDLDEAAAEPTSSISPMTLPSAKAGATSEPGRSTRARRASRRAPPPAATRPARPRGRRAARSPRRARARSRSRRRSPRRRPRRAARARSGDRLPPRAARRCERGSRTAAAWLRPPFAASMPYRWPSPRDA